MKSEMKGGMEGGMKETMRKAVRKTSIWILVIVLTRPMQVLGVGSESNMECDLFRIFLILGAVLILLVCRAKDTLASTANEEDTVYPTQISDQIMRDDKKTELHGVVMNSKGYVRKNNEDNFYFNGIFMHLDNLDEDIFVSSKSNDVIQLYAVCDGVGGTDHGEDAAYRVVKELERRKPEYHQIFYAGEMSSFLKEISDKIYQEAKQSGEKSGTTIAMMLVAERKVIFANVGDSRIYRFRNRKLKQISLDHSKVRRMVSAGVLTPDQVKKDPNRHIITQYMGMSPEVMFTPYIVAGEELQNGDIYLLCSDGLTDMADDDKIAEILESNTEPEEEVSALMTRALHNGGRDNVTVMVLHVCKA